VGPGSRTTTSALLAEVSLKQSSPASNLFVTFSAGMVCSGDLSDDIDGGSSSGERVFSSASQIVGAGRDAAMASSSTWKAPLECERARLT
jgi:hypothetical protein